MNLVVVGIRLDCEGGLGDQQPTESVGASAADGEKKVGEERERGRGERGRGTDVPEGQGGEEVEARRRL